MNKKPVLIVMAAGMGSRYGGLKQMEPVGPAGELIIDFSLYDAKRAGFERAVCIIKKEMEDDFRALMDRGAAKAMDIEYAFQSLDDIPRGTAVPEGRVKPWGTSHAVLAARDMVKGPFAVINADDYYGPEAFRIVYDHLSNLKESPKCQCCMAAYRLENTLTENGSVARGVCRMDASGKLEAIDERLKVQRRGDRVQFTEDDGGTWVDIDPASAVSMNFFGFEESFMDELKAGLSPNLDRIIKENPLKGEYLLPVSVSALLEEGRGEMAVLSCPEKWYGVTYRKDREQVESAMKAMKERGLYPEQLWGRP